MVHRTGRIGIPEKLKKRTVEDVKNKMEEYLAERGIDGEAREKAIAKVLEEKPKRVQRVIEKESRSKGVKRRGEGTRFDFYVHHFVEEPKHMFSGKSGFKRDFK